MGLANLFVRANYLAVAVFASLLVLLAGAWTIYSMGRVPILDLLVNIAIDVGAMSLFLIPGIRAIWRFVANGTVIPPVLVHERHVVASVVTFAGGLGHFFFLISMGGAIDLALLPVWPEEAGKIFIAAIVALLFYLVALLSGELALVGNGQPDPPRPSSALFP
ncbi:MAG TPA: hypothetical protein VGO61_11250 [Steroidobacteraceae bacterium]|jgi:hypothetical protein|nr:hypothetical protein [Steroidobacteraceae bacterium]